MADSTSPSPSIDHDAPTVPGIPLTSLRSRIRYEVSPRRKDDPNAEPSDPRISELRVAVMPG